MKRILFIILIATGLFAQQVDLAKKGCQDILSHRESAEAYFVLGYIVGVKDMKVDRLRKLGLPTVTGVNENEICRATLLMKQDERTYDIPTLALLHFATRNIVIRNNGYTRKQIDSLIKKAQKALGLKKGKKVY